MIRLYASNPRQFKVKVVAQSVLQTTVLTLTCLKEWGKSLGVPRGLSRGRTPTHGFSRRLLQAAGFRGRGRHLLLGTSPGWVF